MLIKDIKIGNRFRKDLGDIEGLVKSIVEIGLLHPIVINSNNELIAGNRRIEAFRQLGYNDIPVNEINLQDILKGELHENAVRKDFTISEHIEIKRALEPELKTEAQERIQSGKKTDEIPSGKLPEGGRVNDILADFLNIGRKTLEKEQTIVEAAEQDPEKFQELLEKVERKETSVDYAAKQVKNAERHKSENIPELPEGKYDIILADPPWNYDINTRGSPDEHYTVMEDKEIKELAVPSADNAILFLWATFPKLPEALSVVKAWGFKYKTGAIWVKDKIGTGYYFRGQAELLLVGEKGEMPTPQEKDRQSSVIEEPRKEHSEKPDKVYEIIEKMYPNRKYLELFARKKRAGWIVWGNEIREQ